MRSVEDPDRNLPGRVMMQAEASLVSPHVRSLSACPRLYTHRWIEATSRLLARQCRRQPLDPARVCHVGVERDSRSAVRTSTA